MIRDSILPGLPVELIESCYANAPGNEIESGKFAHPESSSALAANTFGFFLMRPAVLPPLPGLETTAWLPVRVTLEAIVRFPWSGGRHPCLDALIETHDALIGVESKRYEPYRSKGRTVLSEAYWRPVWGERMAGYERIRDGLRDGSIAFERLDASQLIKHAFGLRTATSSNRPHNGKKAILYYLYAEPEKWSHGDTVQTSKFDVHRAEIDRFKSLVALDEVEFLACDYKSLLTAWADAKFEDVQAHAHAVTAKFSP